MSEKVLRLHVGYHKTGSSSTQIALAEAFDEGHLPVLYPRAGRLENWAFAHQQLVEDLRYGNTDSLDAIVKEHRAEPEKPILISSEDFSMPEASFTLAIMREAFPDHRLEVVAVLRNHVDWMRSYYMERVKRGSTRLDPMLFFQENRHIRAFAPVLRLARSLGAELTVLSYDDLTLPNDLFPVLTGTEMQVEAKFNWNKSLSPQATFAVRKAYLTGIAKRAKVSDVIHNAFVLDNKLRPLLEKVDIYSQVEIQNIFDFYAADRASINEIAGRTLLSEDVPQAKGPRLDADDDPEASYLRKYLSIPG